MIYTLKNDKISVSVKSFGAEICSIKKVEREYLWQPCGGFWEGQSPLLFPLVGPFRSKTIGGLESKMSSHGFLKETEFDLLEKTDTVLKLITKYNENTLELYPFKFEVVVVFEIDGNKFNSYYTIKNVDDKEMVYSFGLHPAFDCKDTENVKFEDYYIKFEKPRNLDACVFSDTNGGVSLTEKKRHMENDNVFMLKRESFKTTIVIDNVDFNTLKYGNTVDGDLVKFSFDGFKIFSMWQQTNAPFVCLEPWRGYNGFTPVSEKVEDNPSVAFLANGEEKQYSMTIEIL